MSAPDAGKAGIDKRSGATTDWDVGHGRAW